MLKRTITIGEALVATLTLLGVIIGFYTHVLVSLSTLDYRVKNVEEQKVERLRHDEKVDQKLDEIIQSVNDLKIQITNKQDKK